MKESVVTTDKDIGPIRNHIELKEVETFFQLSQTQIQTEPKVYLGPQDQWPIGQTPLEIKQFKYGQSNPTYLITDSTGKRFILRRKPTITANLLSKKAHYIEREFWINYDISKLNLTKGFKVPIAEPLCLCENENYIGAMFYVSEFVQGSIFHHPGMPTLNDEQRLKCWKSAIDAAIQIHQLPVEELTHSFKIDKKKKNGKSYFERQVESLGGVEKAQSSQPKTPRIYKFDELSESLCERHPPDPQKPLLIHGDFKIDNFIFNIETFSVVAVLDWELSTLGNPIFDLANLLQNYYFPNEFNKLFLGVEMVKGPQHIPQMLEYYSKEAINATKDSGNLSRWLSSTGNSKIMNGNQSNVVFKYWSIAEAFACYRLSVIIQGIHARFVNGTSSSGFAEKYLNSYDKYSQLALDFLHKKDPKL